VCNFDQLFARTEVGSRRAVVPPVADAPKDDLASKGAAVFRDAKANVGDMISDAGDYAGKKGREAMDNMRGVGDSLAVAVERSVTTRPTPRLRWL
jgi:hypothetical protein